MPSYSDWFMQPLNPLGILPHTPKDVLARWSTSECADSVHFCWGQAFREEYPYVAFRCHAIEYDPPRAPGMPYKDLLGVQEHYPHVRDEGVLFWAELCGWLLVLDPDTKIILTQQESYGQAYLKPLGGTGLGQPNEHLAYHLSNLGLLRHSTFEEFQSRADVRFHDKMYYFRV